MLRVLKYGNRKLYCPADQDYKKQSDIVQAVVTGEGVSVICHKTKNDVTPDVLASALSNMLAQYFSSEELVELILKAEARRGIKE